MAKKVHENSLKNLEKGKKYQFTADDPERAAKAQKKSIEKYKENKANEIKRQDIKDYICKYFFQATDLEEIFSKLSPKEKADFLKSIMPPDKQDFNLSGGVEVQKVFITEKEDKETRQHIHDVINEQ